MIRNCEVTLKNNLAIEIDKNNIKIKELNKIIY
jgi:hypothetical protein